MMNKLGNNSKPQLWKNFCQICDTHTDPEYLPKAIKHLSIIQSG